MIVLYALVAILLGARVAGQTVDDFFITYRYAANLAAGDGFVFNPGERVFGTTAPGWALLLAAGHRVTGWPIPELATALTGLALMALVVLLLREAWMRDRAPEAAVAAALVVSSVYLWVHNGAEHPMALLLVSTAAVVSSRAPVAGGVLAALAVWCRPDFGILALVLALERWGTTRRPPWRWGWGFVGMVAVGLLAARLYWGAWLPGTLHAKRLQAAWRPETWHAGLDYLPECWRQLGAYYAGPWTWGLALLGGLGLAVMWRCGGPALRLLAAGPLALTTTHVLLGVPFYSWYSIPLLVALLFGSCFTVGAVLRWAWAGQRDAQHQGGFRWLGAVVALAVFLPFALHVSQRAAYGYRHFAGIPRLALYQAASDWLRAQAAPGDGVAFVEVGALGYFSDLEVYDLLGLVSPSALPFVADGDLAGAFAVAPTAFVLDRPALHSLMAPIVESAAFRANYRDVARFTEGDLSLTVYQRH